MQEGSSLGKLLALEILIDIWLNLLAVGWNRFKNTSYCCILKN